MILLTLNEQEEKIIDKIISALWEYVQLEPMQINARFRTIFFRTGNKAKWAAGISRRGGN